MNHIYRPLYRAVITWVYIGFINRGFGKPRVPWIIRLIQMQQISNIISSSAFSFTLPTICVDWLSNVSKWYHQTMIYWMFYDHLSDNSPRTLGWTGSMRMIEEEEVDLNLIHAPPPIHTQLGVPPTTGLLFIGDPSQSTCWGLFWADHPPGPTKSPFMTCRVRGAYYYPDPPWVPFY